MKAIERTMFNVDIKWFRINIYHMTQKEFADFLEVSERTVQGWELKGNCPHVIMVLLNYMLKKDMDINVLKKQMLEKEYENECLMLDKL